MNPQTTASEIEAKGLLLVRAKQGDQEALEVLFESCRERLLASASRILSRRQDSEDAVQEGMLAAFTHLDQFHGRSDFLTWATRIVINAALGQIRRAENRPTISWDQFGADPEVSALDKFLVDPKPTPEEICQHTERQRLLEGALQRLSRESRRAIELCKLDDFSLKDAAGAMGLPLSTLKVRLHRGRRSLTLEIKRKTQMRRKVLYGGKSAPARKTREQTLRAA